MDHSTQIFSLLIQDQAEVEGHHHLKEAVTQLLKVVSERLNLDFDEIAPSYAEANYLLPRFGLASLHGLVGGLVIGCELILSD